MVMLLLSMILPVLLMSGQVQYVSASPMTPTVVNNLLKEMCANPAIDAELCHLLSNHTNNPLTEKHSHYFQNSTGSFGRVYQMGVDPYTTRYTPTNLRYTASSAVGYGLANTILVKPNNGNGFVLIDAGSGTREAETVIQAYQDLGILPRQGRLNLSAIIYTHNHIDHTGGANTWLNLALHPPCPVQNDGVDGAYYARMNCVEVICQQKVIDAVINTATRTGQQIDPRSAYMYGMFSVGGAINNGIGPPEKIHGAYFRQPSKTLTNYLDFRVLGLQMWIQYVPSETSDEIIVFMPDGTNNASSANQNPMNFSGVMKASVPRIPPQQLGSGLLFCAEAIQGPPTFPNLYSLRGTTFRNPLTWYQSVDVIRLYNSWGMVGSHGCPVMGSSHIQTVLVNFRDAIQYVHDQTLRRMREGYIPDELVTFVADVPSYLLDNLASISPGLPVTETPKLDPRDFLRTFYGSIPQGVRAIYAGYLGWNKGDPTYFHPLPPTQRADRYLKLLGGAEQLLAEAQTQYDAGVATNSKTEFQWVAEITAYVMSASAPCDAERQKARELKSKSLLRLAMADTTNITELELDYWSLNPNWRNWLVVGGEELALHMINKGFPFGSALSGSTIQEGVPPRYWVQQWCWRYNASNSQLDGQSFGWEFLPNATRWGTQTQRYILSVAKQVVRLIDDPIEVQNQWSSVTHAVSTNYTVYADLLAGDKSWHPNLTVDYMIFVNKFESLMATGAISIVAGTGSYQTVASFFHPTLFDPKPAFDPNIIERTVPVNPNHGACPQTTATGASKPSAGGLSKLDANCGGGCILTLILFVVLFGLGVLGMAAYIWKYPRIRLGGNNSAFQRLQMAD